ncbi:hypothetical protein [Nocardia sp. NPDC050710]|uniref:VOC family protein n=1 Tax=Nocardia sp. NPDC050710 TaxID=3157220 RepID=UPI0033DF1F58
MSVERIGTILPADNVPAAVDFLTAVLRTPATFVDGDRWAQFDIGPVRVSVAGTDREGEAAALSVKVTDLDATLNRLRETGCAVADPVIGPHERRVSVRLDRQSPWTVVLYEPMG